MEQPPRLEPQPEQPKKKMGIVKGIAAGITLSAAALGVGEALKNKSAPGKETLKAVPTTTLEKSPELQEAERAIYEKLITLAWVRGINMALYPNDAVYKNLERQQFLPDFAYWLVKKQPDFAKQMVQKQDPTSIAKIPLPLLELQFQIENPTKDPRICKKMTEEEAKVYIQFEIDGGRFEIPKKVGGK